MIGLLHGANASMPAAGDVIEGGDTIYALVSKQAKKRFFKLLRRKSKVVPGNGKDASEKADAASKEASTG